MLCRLDQLHGVYRWRLRGAGQRRQNALLCVSQSQGRPSAVAATHWQGGPIDAAVQPVRLLRGALPLFLKTVGCLGVLKTGRTIFAVIEAGCLTLRCRMVRVCAFPFCAQHAWRPGQYWVGTRLGDGSPLVVNKYFTCAVDVL